MRPGSFFIKYRLHHILFWMALFGIWYFLRYQDYSSRLTAFNVTLVKVADLALMIYLANELLIPKLLYRKKYLLFTLSFVLMVVASSVLKMFILGAIMNAPQLYDFSSNLKTRVYDNVIPHFFLVTAGAAIKFMLDHSVMQKRVNTLAKEKAEAELNFLKSQINPHFLFNSINSVYFLIDKENREAREALHKFSEMLRYQLYESGGQRIPVEKEISFLQDFVHLQGLRKDGNFKFQFHCDPAVNGFMVEPLLLIPFVENSFKHLSHFTNGRPNEIILDISGSANSLSFNIANTVDGKSQPQINGYGGIGLTNVKRRLELLYPTQHELRITRKEGWFDVRLNIRFNPGEIKQPA